MADIFLKIVNMSISASWIVLVVLLLRLLLKKAPKWITVLLWGVVAIRLICPFSIESVMSLIPSTETISPEIMMDKTPTINSGVPIINNIVNPVIGESFSPDPIASANPLQILIPVLAMAWVAGIAIMLAYTVISYFRVKIKIGTAVLLRDNIYQSENVVSPFVLGIIKPKIYLPFNMNEQDIEHVIAHENAHIRRKDHLWKPFGFLVLTLHWFNPLMWLGYILLCRDIELACDEKVIKELNTEQKADYSQALLTCSVNRRIIAACPLAFGEVGVKNRVKSVLNYKKPAFWIIAIAIVASVVVAVCFLTNPATNTLENIEFLNLEARRQNTVSVLVSDGETYTPVGEVNQDLLNELCNIKISKNEISLNRGEDRDKTHTLVLQTAEDTEPTIYSYVEGLYIHFNSTFTSVWVNNSVKPTLSYRVINPQKAKQIYEDIADFNGTEKLTWTYRPMLSFTGHSFRSFSFDLEYTHIEATCTGGELWNLEAEGQPRDTNMCFEKGKTVYWTPGEGDGKSADKSEVTLTVYNGDTKVQQHTVIFECVSRNYSAGDKYEFYLKDTTEFMLVYSEEGYLTFIERSSISNVGGADKPNNIVTEIIDRTKIEEIFTDDALEPFCVDKKYVYSFPSIKSEYVIVKFDNGYEMNVKNALARGLITITDLDRWNIQYYKEEYDGELELDENGNIVRISSYPKDLYYSTLGHFQTLYEQTPTEQIQKKQDNEELVITKMHYYNTKKEWCADGYSYKYRLEITGRMNNAAKDSTYIVLSNKENITFDQTWKAFGYSSLSTDYFKPEDAMIVGYK